MRHVRIGHDVDRDVRELASARSARRAPARSCRPSRSLRKSSRLPSSGRPGTPGIVVTARAGERNGLVVVAIVTLECERTLTLPTRVSLPRSEPVMHRQVRPRLENGRARQRSKDTVDSILEATARVLVQARLRWPDHERGRGRGRGRLDRLALSILPEQGGAGRGADRAPRRGDERRDPRRARACREPADRAGGARGDRADDPRARARSGAPPRADRAGPARRQLSRCASSINICHRMVAGMLAARQRRARDPRSRARRVRAGLGDRGHRAPLRAALSERLKDPRLARRGDAARHALPRRRARTSDTRPSRRDRRRSPSGRVRCSRRSRRLGSP